MAVPAKPLGFLNAALTERNVAFPEPFRSRILPGYWVYVAAVAYECLVAAVVGWLHADELARRDAGSGDGDEAARAKIGAQQGALRYHSTATSGPGTGSYPSWVNSDNDSSSFT